MIEWMGLIISTSIAVNLLLWLRIDKLKEQLKDALSGDSE